MTHWLKKFLVLTMLTYSVLSLGVQTAHAQVQCNSVNEPQSEPSFESIIDDLEDPGAQSRRNTLLRQEERESNIVEKENEIRTIQEQTTQKQAELQRARDGNNSAEVTRLQNEINSLNTQRATTNADLESLRSTSNSVTNSSSYKQARIEQEITLQIESSIAQGERLTQELQDCGECLDSAILSQRITANKQFTEFLRARLEYELCNNSINIQGTGPNDPNRAVADCRENGELERLRTTMDDWSKCVRESVEAINKVEREREQERVFEVSNIFTLREPAADGGNRRSFLDVTNQIATWMITLVSSLAVTTLIIGGFLMIISGGDESRLETGKTIFTYSLIGIIVTLMAYGIIAFLQSIFYQ